MVWSKSIYANDVWMYTTYGWLIGGEPYPFRMSDIDRGHGEGGIAGKVKNGHSEGA